MNRPWVRFLLRALLSGGLFALILSRVRWNELAALFRGVHFAPLLAGWLLGAACLLLMAARTRLMLGQWQIALGYRPVLAMTWLGQFCNTFLPGSTGGDVVKFLRLCRLVPGAKAAGFAALVADRALALLALATLAGTVLACGDHRLLWQMAEGASNGFGRRWWLGAAALMIVMALAAAIAWGRYNAWTSRIVERLRRVAGTFAAGLRPTPAVGVALLLALLVHLLGLTACCLYCRALEIPATFTQIVLVWPVIMVAVMLPLTVNGHGLREYILLYYFQRWHLVSALPGGGGIAETVVALSLLMVMTDLSWSLPGGFYLWSKGRHDTPAAAPVAGAVPLRHSLS